MLFRRRALRAFLSFTLALFVLIAAHRVLIAFHARAYWTVAAAVLQLELITGDEWVYVKKFYGIPISVFRPHEVFPLIREQSDKRKRFLAHTLINYAESLNVRNADGDTPLLYAVRYGGAEGILGGLLVRREGFTARDREGLIAMELALKQKSHTIASHVAGAQPFRRLNALGDQALHLSIRYGDEHTATNLITRFGKKLFRQRNYQGDTALHLLMDAKHPWSSRIFGTLMSAKVNPNVKNHAGNTPLHVAVMSGAGERAEQLLANPEDVDVGIRNGENKTALALAIQRADPYILNLLLKLDRRLATKPAYKAELKALVPERHREAILSLLDTYGAAL